MNTTTVGNDNEYICRISRNPGRSGRARGRVRASRALVAKRKKRVRRLLRKEEEEKERSKVVKEKVLEERRRRRRLKTH